MNERERKIWNKLKSEVFNETSDKICVFCGKVLTIDRFSVDHIIPRCYGGTNDKSNLVICCRICNKIKSNYIVFSNLTDRIIYPIIDVPYYFGLENWNTKIKKLWRKI